MLLTTEEALLRHPIEAALLYEHGIRICPLSTFVDDVASTGSEFQPQPRKRLHKSTLRAFCETVLRSKEVHFPGHISSGTSWILEWAISMQKVRPTPFLPL
jgi:hypothetical protein